MTAQNGRWAKIAADGAIFLSRHSPEKPERPEKFMNYCGFILREATAGCGAEHGPDRSVAVAVAGQFLRSHPSCL
jgi:hypothetical protein